MNENIQFLKDLQQELKTQDNDCQAAPRFWVLMDYRWVSALPDDGERVSVVLPEECDDYVLDDLVDDIINYNISYSYSIDDEAIGDLEEMNSYYMSDEGELLEWIQANIDSEAYLVYEKEEEFIVPDTMFLTKQEAKDHIKKNHHHYTSKVHTYAMTAWRAPKVEKLLGILENFDWDSLKGQG
ncbi:hypothetical protein Goe25_02090 [Bacillus phage vB_BsuM-Goe25]|nr:hypothetical protein Goe25_02090 [Bacillus phage vB_BsuM-Goe25]